MSGRLRSSFAADWSSWTYGTLVPDVLAFLDDQPPTTLREEVDLLLLDLSERFEHGCPRPVEEYLAARPALAADADVAARLVAAEFEFREARGDKPTIAEYVARFPELADRLRPLLVPLPSTIVGEQPSDPLGRTMSFLGDSEETPSRHVAKEDRHGEDPQPIPDRLGDYDLLEELGRGGMGVVYRAHDRRIDRDVAIKVLHLSGGGNREEVLAEARAQGGVQHPHVVPVHHVDRLESGDWYVVSRYLPGGSLAERIKSPTKPSIRQSVEWCVQIAEGLHAAHRRGLVHRDLKPANVLLDEEDQALVGDFGLALHESNQSRSRGEVAGTPAYMAPEQVRGESHHLDGRADVWALGVVLYELLAGFRPFHGSTLSALREEIEQREPKSLRVANPEIPTELDEIVLRCLRKPVGERYATAADMARDLRRWLADDRPLVLLRSLLVAAGIALVAVAVGFAVWWRPGRMPTTPVVDAYPPAATTEVADQVDTTVGVRVWGAGKLGLSIEDPRALPIRNGDQVRVEVASSEPTHVYLFWVDAGGEAVELYPHDPERGLLAGGPTSRVASPETANRGWPVTGVTGTDTLLVFTSRTPRPADEKIADRIRLPIVDTVEKGVVRFVIDPAKTPRVAAARHRGVGAVSRKIDDPVLDLMARLKEDFDTVEALHIPHVAAGP